MADILILGAGVVGLHTALRLALQTEHRVKVWAADLTNLTSAYAGAYWWPTESIGEPANLIQWSLATFQFLHGLGLEAGVVNRKLIGLMDKPWQIPAWFDTVSGTRHAKADEVTPTFPYGLVIDSAPVIEPPVHLQWLRQRLAGLGVDIKVRKLNSLAPALQECPIVINCTGLGAKALCQDNDLHPMSGQLVKIKRKNIENVWFIGSRPERNAYIIPQPTCTILGGTYFENDFSTNPDPQEALAILDRCNRLCPELGATRDDIIDGSKALRPVRSKIRLECEKIDDQTVIHNYGHGRAGWTLSWGCAGAVANLIDESS